MLKQHPEDFWTKLSHQKSQAKESSRARRCKQWYAETPGTDRKKNAPWDLQPQLEQRTSAWGMKNSTSCPSFKEGKGQDQLKQLSPDQLTQLCWEAHGTRHHPSSHLVPGDQQCIQPLTDRLPSTSQHWRSACTPHSRRWKLLPREAKAASSLFQPVKGVRPDVEKRTAVETAESRSFRSNVQMDQQLSLPQSGQSEAWWIAQQRDQAKWGSPARKRPLTHSILSVRKWHCQHPPT